MTRRTFFNAFLIALILGIWVMVAGSIAPDFVILGQSLAAWSVLISVVGSIYLYRQLLSFLRARAHAREKVTRIAIIDRPLSMIVGGRVGALFFIVCFLSVLEIQIERFCLSPPAWQIRLNE